MENVQVYPKYKLCEINSLMEPPLPLPLITLADAPAAALSFYGRNSVKNDILCKMIL